MARKIPPPKQLHQERTLAEFLKKDLIIEGREAWDETEEDRDKSD